NSSLNELPNPNNGRCSSSYPKDEHSEMAESASKKMRLIQATTVVQLQIQQESKRKKDELNDDNIWKQSINVLCTIHMEDPEINRFVLLKNISPSESEEEIAEALKDMGYSLKKVERFKGLPMAKSLLGTSNDVKKALQDKEIRIGYRLTKITFHPVFWFESFHHRKKPSKQKCVLCHGKHASNSVMCPAIRKVREKIGIHFSRREKVKNIKDRDRQVQETDQDEVSKLRAQLQETVKHLSAIVQALSPLLHQQEYEQQQEE
ncbi:hypothetical protein RFI_20796, partial [Reticulomyxa filosa]